jgi:hypothetical protein
VAVLPCAIDDAVVGCLTCQAVRLTVFWGLLAVKVWRIWPSYTFRCRYEILASPFTSLILDACLPHVGPAVQRTLPVRRKHGATRLAQTLIQSSIVSRSRIARHFRRSERFRRHTTRVTHMDVAASAPLLCDSVPEPWFARSPGQGVICMR